MVIQKLMNEYLKCLGDNVFLCSFPRDNVVLAVNFWSMFSYINAPDHHNKYMNQAGTINYLYFIAKEIEVQRDVTPLRSHDW